MTRWLIVVSLLGLTIPVAPRVAHADPLYACHTASPSTKILASFKPDTPLRDLVAWLAGFSCKSVVFASDVPQHATKVTIVAPSPLTPKQAVQLFVDAVEATGLVVVQKPDTFIIKLGPGMPKGCPDIAQASPPATGPGPSPRIPIPQPPDRDDSLSRDDLSARSATEVRKIDDTHYEIARKLVDDLLVNPSSLMTQARIVPAMQNGKPVGFKLYAIRPSSLYARLGLVNGDTVHSINGMSLHTIELVLEVYAKLRDATSFELDLTRRGKPVTLSWQVR